MVGWLTTFLKPSRLEAIPRGRCNLTCRAESTSVLDGASIGEKSLRLINLIRRNTPVEIDMVEGPFRVTVMGER